MNVYPHPDSKYTEIQCASAKGYTAIVKKTVNSGDLGVFFPPDGKLSDEFCRFNKLYRKDPDTGEPVKGGYLDENGRIKAIKFGGVKSDGLWMPIEQAVSMFKKRDGSLCVRSEEMEEGAEIDSFGGIQICEKYYTPATLKQMRNDAVVKKGLRDKKHFVFPEHFDTNKFRVNCDNILDDSLVVVTEKLHGTSARMALVEVTTEKFSDWQKRLFDWGFGRWIRFKPKVEKSWDFLVGSRTVVLQGDRQNDKQQFRFDVAKSVRPFILKNEVIYGEIVGYDQNGKLIMGSMNSEAVSDKEFSKKYGKQMVYRYGCKEKQCDFFVYRITNINPEGQEIELSWNQVKKRCKDMGIKHVPELFVCIHKRELTEDFRAYVESLSSGESKVDPSHIREGVCVRVENENGVKVFKEKSWEFCAMEGNLKSNDSYVDTEEIS